MDGVLVEKEAIYRELYRPNLVARKGLIDFLEGAKKANVSQTTFWIPHWEFQAGRTVLGLSRAGSGRLRRPELD